MSLTIGRVVLADPDEVKVSGDQVDFTVEMSNTTLQDLKAARQQLAGLVNNPDEEAIPVIWSEDSTFDGFYRVLNVSIPSSPTMLTNFYVPPATISLRRVGGYANPWFELVTQAVVRTNGHGITAPSTIIATTPAVSTLSGDIVDLYPSITAGSPNSRTISNGFTIGVYRRTAPITVTSVRYSALASSFYLGGATIELQYGTSTWYPVVGYQTYDHGATSFLGTPVSAWRISNGIIRLTSTTVPTSAGAGILEIWDNVAGAWETTTQTVSWTSSGGIGNLGSNVVIKALVVVRNSPEQVTIRVQTAAKSETWTIQRGAHFAMCTVYDPSLNTPGNPGYRLGFSGTGVAGTSITGGIRQTSNDASGNRLVLATNTARTAITADTAIQPTSQSHSSTYMIGIELGGSSAVAGDTAADLVEQFIGAVAWRQRIVRQ